MDAKSCLMEVAFEPPPTLIDCFNLTASICAYLSSQRLLNEETLTGAVLGALSTSMHLKSMPTDPSGKDDFDCFWVPYNRGRHKNPGSEAANGADLALVILGTNGVSRLAIFQAKRAVVHYGQSGTKRKREWGIDVKHATMTEAGSESSQMVALLTRALVQLTLNGTPLPASAKDHEIKHISWVHYLAYGPGEPKCLPLSMMSDALLRETTSDNYRNMVPFDPNTARTFSQVLRAGVSHSTKEWLTVKNKALFDSLPGWLDLMPVAIAGSKKGWEMAPKKWQQNSTVIQASAPTHLRRKRSKLSDN